MESPLRQRDGGVPRLENLIHDIDGKCSAKSWKAVRKCRKRKQGNIAEIVGLAAIKYGDLSNQAAKDYSFDVDRFTSFEGDTGPYILYTIVRIKSILAKYQDQGGSLENLELAPAISPDERR